MKEIDKNLASRPLTNNEAYLDVLYNGVVLDNNPKRQQIASEPNNNTELMLLPLRSLMTGGPIPEFPTSFEAVKLLSVSELNVLLYPLDKEAKGPYKQKLEELVCLNVRLLDVFKPDIGH